MQIYPLYIVIEEPSEQLSVIIPRKVHIKAAANSTENNEQCPFSEIIWPSIT